MDLIGDIFSKHFVSNGKWCHKQDVINYVNEIYNSFKDPKVEVIEQFAEDDRVTTKRRWTGFQIKNYHGKPATNEPMSWDEVSVVRLVNQKIVDDWMIQGELFFASSQYK